MRVRGPSASRAQRRCHHPPSQTVDALEPRRLFAATLLADVNPGAASSPVSYLPATPPVQAGARLVFRALVSRLIYAARFVRRLPRLLLRVAAVVVRRLFILPTRWLMNRTKMRLHAFLVWRKGDQVP